MCAFTTLSLKVLGGPSIIALLILTIGLPPALHSGNLVMFPFLPPSPLLLLVECNAGVRVLYAPPSPSLPPSPPSPTRQRHDLARTMM